MIFDMAFWSMLLYSLMLGNLIGGKCCCGCKCDRCDGGTAPCEVQVDISGISDDGGTCGDCDQFNGAYILDKRTSAIFNPAILGCVWRYDLPGDGYCNGFQQQNSTLLEFYRTNGNLSFVVFYRPQGGSTQSIAWWISETAPDCNGFDEHSITFNSEFMNGCQSDGSPALVSAA